MIVYEANKHEFLEDVFHDELVTNICSNYTSKVGKINEAEVRSWDNSMQYMYRVLMDDEIPDNAGVAIEFKIPYTSKRVDFLISGKNNNDPAIVIVELKQWSRAEKIEGKEAIVKTAMGGGLVETTHPSYQAWSYASLIKDYNENVQKDRIELHPCAYLHNYLLQPENEPLTDDVYTYYVDQAPVFAKGGAGKLRAFIKQYLTHGDNKENIYKIEKGKIRPSKSLQDTLNSMLAGNDEFLMIDDQKVVYETALQLAEEAKRTNTKQVLVVEGGPGTGKSVLAVNLLVELTNRNQTVQYVTKNSAPRNVYANKLKQDYRKTHIDNLFKGSGSYVDRPRDELDVLVVDEAHRLNEKSGLFQNLGENQMKEIIHTSKLAVFFMDEHQRVTLKDVGTTKEIEAFTKQEGGSLHRMKLASQFRCNGSDGYLAWVDDTLGIRETANEHFMGNDYDFRVFSDPNELYETISALNEQNNKARLVAGYCWEWPKKERAYSDAHDITLPEHSFGISWNLDTSNTWAIDAGSVTEVGCIHTCQGLEFDYVGVIIGDDLVHRDGELQTDYTKRAKTDQSLRGIKKMMKEEPEKAGKLADEIIRNTYRTLMTRGQRGCFIYCTDKELEQYFKERLALTELGYKPESFFKKGLEVAENYSEYE